uniref:Uncharacterized protein n=1 Tax=Magallana gigas TaxID=29159 RepID=K1Q5S2_MAGGI
MGLYKVTGFVATVITFVSYTVSFSAPFWYYIDLGTREIYGGLWQSCLSNFITKTCSNNVLTSNPAGMIFLCVTIFAAKFRDRDYQKEDLSFSFYLTFVAILTSLWTGVILIVGNIKGD